RLVDMIEVGERNMIDIGDVVSARIFWKLCGPEIFLRFVLEDIQRKIESQEDAQGLATFAFAGRPLIERDLRHRRNVGHRRGAQGNKRCQQSLPGLQRGKLGRIEEGKQADQDRCREETYEDNISTNHACMHLDINNRNLLDSTPKRPQAVFHWKSVQTLTLESRRFFARFNASHPSHTLPL